MPNPSSLRVAVVGTVGVPANYGGFETLVENLARYHDRTDAPEELVVYCSSKSYEARPDRYLRAKLRYLPLQANGAQSMPYDIWSMLSAVRGGADVVLVLGVSGAIFLPVLRRLSRARLICNIDGIEWRREKWGNTQRRILKVSEAMAVRHAHDVVADNGAIAEYVGESYGRECSVIAYGGDHAVKAPPTPVSELDLPARYAFNLCRIEPENNVHMLLDAFAERGDLPLVCVGNWDRSAYGQALKARYGNAPGIRILDPIYDIGKLHTLRAGASLYLHGHSAGGTNPSLVEAMQFGVPVLAFDVSFNRYTTEGRALFFEDAAALRRLVDESDADKLARVGADMAELARERYSWDAIGAAYFSLIRGSGSGGVA